MSPSVSFIKFLADDICNNRFHDAYTRLPEAQRLMKKMSPAELELSGHAIEGARKVHTRDFHEFNKFVEQREGKKLQIFPAASFFYLTYFTPRN
jgi:hypothetical protein